LADLGADAVIFFSIEREFAVAMASRQRFDRRFTRQKRANRVEPEALL